MGLMEFLEDAKQQATAGAAEAKAAATARDQALARIERKLDALLERAGLDPKEIGDAATS